MASYSPSEMEAMASSWSAVNSSTRAVICGPVSSASSTRAVRPSGPTSARAAMASWISLTCPGFRVKLMEYSCRNGSDQTGRGWMCGRPLLRGLHVTDTGRVRSAAVISRCGIIIPERSDEMPRPTETTDPALVTEFVCDHCGGGFRVYTSQIPKKPRTFVFCSRECKAAHQVRGGFTTEDVDRFWSKVLRR